MLRALTDRHVLETERARIAVGWTLVEDVVMILTLVLLPAFVQLAAGGEASAGDAVAVQGVAPAVALTVAKVAGFVALMLVVGRRLIPLLLHAIAYTGNRELFRLAVLAIALGVAYGAAALFDVSFALGAFFAGMILAESELSQQAAQESLPLRDAFAVLFFVSVGMLVDPMIVVRQPLQVLAVVALIVPVKAVLAYAIVRAFRYDRTTAMTLAVSRAQIGEFSFILAGLGVSLGVLPPEGRDLILAGAILSIVVNPALFGLAERRIAAAQTRAAADVALAPPLAQTTMSGHAVVVGFGRVGSLAAQTLREHGEPVLIVEDNDELAANARAQGFTVLSGNAARPEVLAAANLAGAGWLLVAIPNAFEAGQVVLQARTANPRLPIIARAHSDAEVDHLTGLGANHTIMGEREIALGMVSYIDALRLAAGTSD